MNTINVYTTSSCPYCVAAKDWLRKKNYPFNEINLNNTEDRDKFKEEHPALRTVPQIFVVSDAGETNIGGFTDLIKSEELLKRQISSKNS